MKITWDKNIFVKKTVLGPAVTYACEGRIIKDKEDGEKRGVKDSINTYWCRDVGTENRK